MLVEKYPQLFSSNFIAKSIL